jgi:hypothetical protein
MKYDDKKIEETKEWLRDRFGRGMDEMHEILLRDAEGFEMSLHGFCQEMAWCEHEEYMILLEFVARSEKWREVFSGGLVDDDEYGYGGKLSHELLGGSVKTWLDLYYALEKEYLPFRDQIFDYASCMATTLGLPKWEFLLELCERRAVIRKLADLVGKTYDECKPLFWDIRMLEFIGITKDEVEGFRKRVFDRISKPNWEGNERV